MSDIKKSELTPLMEQYLTIKEQNKDMILLYRMGDFYETFFEDAKTISKILGIALTKRSHGKGGDAPLAGFPYHSLDTYLPRLIEAGQKVAICEQVEDPKKAKVIVKREVVEIVTPGTTISEKLLENKKNNFLCSIFLQNKIAALSYIDVSTGEFYTAQMDESQVSDFLFSFSPKEIIISKSQEEQVQKLIQKYSVSLVSKLDEWHFTYNYCYNKLINHFTVKNLKGFGIEEDSSLIIAAGIIIYYLQENYKQHLKHISKLQKIHIGNYMFLDESTRKNLELTFNLMSGNKEGSLISIIDQTKTPMGGRLLKKWLNNPLINKNEILKRQNNVEFYFKNEEFTKVLQQLLSNIFDIERIAARLAAGKINPRELIFLKNSLKTILEIDELFNEKKIEKDYKPKFINLSKLVKLVENSLNEQAPINIKDGNIIKQGYSKELDSLKSMANDGKSWMADYQQKERQETGISTLKIGYNRIFGYYLDVTRVNKNKVPEKYIRKQTLANSERYITPELKEYEDKILGAEEKIADLEYEIFTIIRDQVKTYISGIQSNAYLIAKIDIFCNFAKLAKLNNYTKPEIVDKPILEIEKGRHPVVEKMLSAGEDFIDNETFLSNEKNQVIIITGPNMSGKSTYLRQVGLIVLLAQVGCYVPAHKVKMGVVDRIFTRVGASDNLTKGESTFMVEMLETANILNNATKQSLILLDEIGRGTSTYDGLSIAWSIAEYLHNNESTSAKTLFATHYHELTELAIMYPRIKNFNVAVEEIGDRVIFLRKIIPGGTDNSYGIHVAGMAGLPKQVLERAKEILSNLEANELTPNKQPKLAKRQPGRQIDKNQLTIFDAIQESKIENEIKQIDINNLTPLDALNKINKLKNLLK